MSGVLSSRTVLLWALATWPMVCAGRTPQPVSVYFDDQFRGYDGLWSAAQIRVGTPSQYLSLLPNTVNSEIWVVDAQSCGNSTVCQQVRGGVFYQAQSSTFINQGDFETGYLLAPTPLEAHYGLDVVAISDTISASNQSVAIFGSADLLLGSLGLNVKSVRFNGTTDHPSLISTLVHNESVIPSHSYGYTAGASYAERSIPGSLTLGGTDVTRYMRNNVSFKLSIENFNPLLALRSVTVTSSSQAVAMPANWNANPLTLMAETNAATYTVDTSTPFLWMPESVCDEFASALNLTYDATLNLYVFSNGTSPQNLTNWDLTFTFTLAASTTTSETVTIPVSYNAFNLQLRYPFPGFDGNASSAAVNYFPLRRANSTLQYIIGRAFFQEAYLTVDFERGNFSVSSAIFPDLNTINPTLVAIDRDPKSVWPGPQISGQNLSAGQKAGIAVGVVIAAVLALLILVLYLRQRRRSSQGDGEKSKKSSFNLLRFVKQRKDSSNVMNELPADKRHPGEMQADATNTRFELPGSDPIEMSAGAVPSSYFEGHKETSELTPGDDQARRNSISKGVFLTIGAASVRSQSPLPPYTLSDGSGQVNTNSTGQSQAVSSGISSQSTDNRQTQGTGSHSSGEQGISPLGATFPNSEIASPATLLHRSPSDPQRHLSSTLSTGSRNTLAYHLSLRDPTPMRTVSRSSRFREELDEEDGPATADEEKPKMIRHRFSWEE